MINYCALIRKDGSSDKKKESTVQVFQIAWEKRAEERHIYVVYLHLY